MLNVCDPCLMVMTRCPRRWSSAPSRTVSVVLPLCFLPITATIGGRAMFLREDALLGRVDVHEETGWIAEARDVGHRHACDAHVVVETDDTSVVRRDAVLDSSHARGPVVGAQRLEPAPGVAFGDGDIRVLSRIAQCAQ